MSSLQETLTALEGEHAEALRWFRSHSGQIIRWSEIKEHAETGARLVNQAKGIYKPAYMDYALSVRQTLNGPYDDLEIERRSDGSWLYPYFQENPDPSRRDNEATNRGLMKCMADRIPVGVLVQTKPKPGVEYKVIGLGHVIDWQDGYFFLEGFTDSGDLPAADQHSIAAMSRARALKKPVPQEAFDPNNKDDKREKTIAEVVRRRGQAKFRRDLLHAYQRRCAITRCDAVEALEAAHITPYLGDATNHTQNGLLLRADLHSLFDLGFISIDPNTMTVRLSSILRSTSYRELDGRKIAVPARSDDAPSQEALTQHLEWAGLDQT